MSYEKDAWDELADQGNGIIGQHLKCAKGKWLLDDAPVNDSVKIVVIMDSATLGEVLWAGGQIAERHTGRIADGFVPPRQLTDGFNPHVGFQAVRSDEENLGALVTFTSSSWGGRSAFLNLADQFRLRQRRFFPICTLSTKAKGDINGNVDPVFKIVGWSPRENFQELLAPPAEKPDAVTYAPSLESPPAPEGLPEMIDGDADFVDF
jgi:hypothetical protein